MHKAGDIVLVPFPFTDLSGGKVRPALILGVQEEGKDITVCFISSVEGHTTSKQVRKFEVSVDPNDKHCKKTGLKLKSVIKVTKIATLEKTVILGRMGVLHTKDTQKVKSILRLYFGL